MSVSDTAHRGIWTTTPNVLMVSGSFVSVNGSITSTNDPEGFAPVTRSAEATYVWTFADSMIVSNFLGLHFTITHTLTDLTFASYTPLYNITVAAATITAKFYNFTAANDVTLTAAAADLIGTCYWNMFVRDPYPQAK